MLQLLLHSKQRQGQQDTLVEPLPLPAQLPHLLRSLRRSALQRLLQQQVVPATQACSRRVQQLPSATLRVVRAHPCLALVRSCLQVHLAVAAVQAQLRIVALQVCSWVVQQEVRQQGFKHALSNATKVQLQPVARAAPRHGLQPVLSVGMAQGFQLSGLALRSWAVLHPLVGLACHRVPPWVAAPSKYHQLWQATLLLALHLVLVETCRLLPTVAL
jgi:hypothetical protein